MDIGISQHKLHETDDIQERSQDTSVTAGLDLTLSSCCGLVRSVVASSGGPLRAVRGRSRRWSYGIARLGPIRCSSRRTASKQKRRIRYLTNHHDQYISDAILKWIMSTGVFSQNNLEPMLLVIQMHQTYKNGAETYPYWVPP